MNINNLLCTWPLGANLPKNLGTYAGRFTFSVQKPDFSNKLIKDDIFSMQVKLGQGQTWAVVCRARTGGALGLGQGLDQGYMLGLVMAGQVTNEVMIAVQVACFEYPIILRTIDQLVFCFTSLCCGRSKSLALIGTRGQ